MNWNAGFRAIMADVAAEQGQTYDEYLIEHVPTRGLLVVDRRVWWKKVKT